MASKDKTQELHEVLTEEFLSCKICFEQLKEPKSLSCLHTFCRECLDMYVSTQNHSLLWRQVDCPICRAVTRLPAGGVHGLTTNFMLSNLGDVLSKQPKPAPKEALTEKECVVHPGKICVLFCDTCDEILCPECVINLVNNPDSKHKSHKLSELGTVSQEEIRETKDKVKYSVERIRHHLDLLDNVVGATAKYSAQLVGRKLDLEQMVKARAESVKAAVDQWKSQCIQDLNALHAAEQNRIDQVEQTASEIQGKFCVLGPKLQDMIPKLDKGDQKVFHTVFELETEYANMLSNLREKCYEQCFSAELCVRDQVCVQSEFPNCEYFASDALMDHFGRIEVEYGENTFRDLENVAENKVTSESNLENSVQSRVTTVDYGLPHPCIESSTSSTGTGEIPSRLVAIIPEWLYDENHDKTEHKSDAGTLHFENDNVPQSEGGAGAASFQAVSDTSEHLRNVLREALSDLGNEASGFSRRSPPPSRSNLFSRFLLDTLVPSPTDLCHELNFQVYNANLISLRVGSESEFIISNGRRNEVLIFDEDGQYMCKFGQRRGNPNLNITDIWDAMELPDGTVGVADGNSGCIKIYERNGLFRGRINHPNIQECNSITVNGTGQIIIADAIADKVHVLEQFPGKSIVKEIYSYRSRGRVLKQFNRPTYVETNGSNNDDIVVLDNSTPNRGGVKVFDRDGHFRFKYDFNHRGSKVFEDAVAICTDDEGRIYIIDQDTSNIHIITEDGEYLAMVYSHQFREYVDQPELIAIQDEKLVLANKKGDVAIFHIEITPFYGADEDMMWL